MAGELISIGDLVLVEETGEVVEWPQGSASGPERIDYFVRQYGFAREQEAAWSQAKAAYSAVLQSLLSEAGVASRKGDAGSVTAVPDGETVKAPAKNLGKAVAAEMLTHDQAGMLAVRAAKELDRAEVEAWIGEQPEPQRAALREVLFDRVPRKGYAMVRPARHAAPEITSR
jgi:hypothetical protein